MKFTKSHIASILHLLQELCRFMGAHKNVEYSIN